MSVLSVCCLKKGNRLTVARYFLPSDKSPVLLTLFVFWIPFQRSQGTARSQSSQLSEPLWTDPGLQNGIGALDLTSTWKKKKKKRRRETIRPHFPPESLYRYEKPSTKLFLCQEDRSAPADQSITTSFVTRLRGRHDHVGLFRYLSTETCSGALRTEKQKKEMIWQGWSKHARQSDHFELFCFPLPPSESVHHKVSEFKGAASDYQVIFKDRTVIKIGF